MHVPQQQRWFTAIPLPYVEDARFWNTDGGLLCHGLNNLGVFSRFVVFGEPAEHDNPPLVLCRPEQMQNAAWWQQWRLNAVILTSWGAPRLEPIARAIKQSGTRLIVRMDSDGMKSPRIDFRRFLAAAYFEAKALQTPLAAAHALVKTLAYRFVGRAYDVKLCTHLSHADVIAIESSLARERLARYLRLMRRDDIVSRLRVLPPAVKVGIVSQRPIQKARRIIAVGRWKSYQKDAPSLVKVLARTLESEPNYSAVLAGDGADFLRRLMAKVPPKIASRIAILGHVPQEQLLREYQQAQIILFTSRYEGFPYAAGEALCCGCTVVGAGELPSMNYICSRAGGTASISRSVQDLSDALGAEIDAWRRDERDPEHISRWWQNRVAPERVASSMLGFVEELKA